MVKITISGEGLSHKTEISPHLAEDIIRMVLDNRQKMRELKKDTAPIKRDPNA